MGLTHFPVPSVVLSCVLVVLSCSRRVCRTCNDCRGVSRGIKIDENTPRPPWEEKEVVEEVTFGDGRKRKNTPIEVEVDLE